MWDKLLCSRFAVPLALWRQGRKLPLPENVVKKIAYIAEGMLQ